MNNFTLEVFDDEGSSCTFYTVRGADELQSETEKFFAKYRQDAILKKPLQELAKFLEIVIGEEDGALEHYFRFENRAQALPPSGSFSIEEVRINYGNFPLRLYCLRISESLVVLFNGAEKTSQSAQGGNTSMVFHEANQYARKIMDAMINKDIGIADDQRTFVSYEGSSEIIIY